VVELALARPAAASTLSTVVAAIPRSANSSAARWFDHGVLEASATGEHTAAGGGEFDLHAGAAMLDYVMVTGPTGWPSG
jgi:hypothetical protein